MKMLPFMKRAAAFHKIMYLVQKNWFIYPFYGSPFLDIGE